MSKPPATLRYNAYRRPYRAHKSSAKQRGIGFTLTYDQWLKIWFLSGRLEERGIYVMSRPYDTGAYELGNVFIQTASQNGKDASYGKPAVWKDKETKYAIALFMKGHSLLYIAEKMGRTIGAVKNKIYRNVSLTAWQEMAQLRISSRK